MSEAIGTSSMGTSGAPSMGSAPSMGVFEGSSTGSMPSVESEFSRESINTNPPGISSATGMAGEQAAKVVVDTVKHVGVDNALEVLAGDPQQHSSPDAEKPSPIRLAYKIARMEQDEPMPDNEADKIARLQKQLEEMKRKQKMLELQLAETLKKIQTAQSVAKGKGEEVETLSTVATEQENLLHAQEKVLIDFTHSTDVLPHAA